MRQAYLVTSEPYEENEIERRSHQIRREENNDVHERYERDAEIL